MNTNIFEMTERENIVSVEVVFDNTASVLINSKLLKGLTFDIKKDNADRDIASNERINIPYEIVADNVRLVLSKKANKYIICNVCNQMSLKLILSCLIAIIISIIYINHLETKFEFKYSDIIEKNSFIGTIEDIKKETDYYSTYILKIESINNRNLKNTNILLKVKKNKESKQYKYGDKISGIGNFEKPSKRRNYKGFDYAQYLKTENIYMICNTECKNIKVISKNAQFVGNVWINKLRSNAKNNLLK